MWGKFFAALGGIMLGFAVDQLFRFIAINFRILTQSVLYKTIHIDDILAIVFMLLLTMLLKQKQIRLLCLIGAALIIGIEIKEMIFTL